MKYISAGEAALKWGISTRRVQYFCANDKIPGARHIGKQWAIPADSARPTDGRTRQGKSIKSEIAYHFPIFLYSPYYSDTSGLNEMELQLLQAQKLRLEGNYVESITLCRNMLSNRITPEFAAGVYCTIGFDAFLLGLISEYNNCIASLEKIQEMKLAYTEDIKLMKASLRYHCVFDSDVIYDIDVSKLSHEAITYYKYLLLTVSALSVPIKRKGSLQYLRSEAVAFEQEGITPATFAVHCILACIGNLNHSMQDREQHLRIAIQMAIENNWVSNLSKYYNVIPTMFDKCFESFGSDYLAQVKRMHKISIKNWTLIHRILTGDTNECSCQQTELLLLISHGYSYKQIAAIKGVSQASVKRDIQEIKTTMNVSTKADLTQLAKKMFNNDIPNT